MEEIALSKTFPATQGTARADAGIQDGDPDWAVDALEAREELDRLLATPDDWQDAGEAIELGAQKGYTFQILLSVCRARISRGHGAELARLEQLRQRLQAAARRAISLSDPEANLREISSSLRSSFKPAAALETVDELIRRLRAR